MTTGAETGDRPPERPADRRRGPPPQFHGPRVNHQIRIRQIRVIDDEGKQLGVLETADALALAIRKGLDLVEIAPTQRPPVCRIMDFGKYKYELKKKEQASKRKQHQVQVKEVRVRPKIAEHDVQVKVRQARDFLDAGDKVMVNCLFRGREMAHRDVGEKVLQKVYELLQDIAKIEREPQMEGRRMVMLLTKR
jgi:translation initiation factor IF-3